MTEKSFDKEMWVELFREIGLSEPQMKQWHAAFETRHPDAHHSFLTWLGASAPDIDRIRDSSRGEWSRE